MARIKNTLLIIIILFLPIATHSKGSAAEISNILEAERIVYDDPRSIDTEKIDELENVYKPPPPPSLIDLDKDEKFHDKKMKYSGLALFVFNITMFTAGMVFVKTQNGKKV